MSSGTYTLGTLDGRLNRAQTLLVIERLRAAHPKAIFDMATVSDPRTNRQSASELYCANSAAEIELLLSQLLDGEFQLLDVAAEDIVRPLPNGLVVAAVPERNTPFDALLHKGGCIADDLEDGTRVGVLSRRSMAQIHQLWPQLKPKLLYGGAVEALDAYLQDEAVDCLVMPAAIAERLGVQDIVTEIFFPEMTLPGAGQGLIAIIARAGDAEALAMAGAVDSPQSRAEMTAELAFRERICSDQDCPLGVLAQAGEDSLIITGAVGSLHGHSMNQAVLRGPSSEAAALGVRLAEQLLLNTASLIDLLEADFPEGLPVELEEGAAAPQENDDLREASRPEDLDEEIESGGDDPYDDDYVEPRDDY